MNFGLMTNDAFHFRTIIEVMLLLNPMGYSSVLKNGISMWCANDPGSVAMSFKLQNDMLSMFKLHSKANIVLPIDLLSKCLRKVTRSDTLKLSDTDSALMVHSKSNRTSMTVSTVVNKLIQQYVVLDLPNTVDYNTPGVLVDSKNFFNACKEIVDGNIVSIKLVGDFAIEFMVGVKYVVHSVAKVGVDTSKTVNYSADFNIDDLMRFYKIQAVSPRLRIYLKSAMPAKITAMTPLGPVAFYVKSIDMK